MRRERPDFARAYCEDVGVLQTAALKTAATINPSTDAGATDLQKVRRACPGRRPKVQLQTRLRAVSHIHRKRVPWVTAIPIVRRQYARKGNSPVASELELEMRTDEAVYFETDRKRDRSQVYRSHGRLGQTLSCLSAAASGSRGTGSHERARAERHGLVSLRN